MIVYAIAEDIIIAAIKNNVLVINVLPPPWLRRLPYS